MFFSGELKFFKKNVGLRLVRKRTPYKKKVIFETKISNFTRIKGTFCLNQGTAVHVRTLCFYENDCFAQ